MKSIIIKLKSYTLDFKMEHPTNYVGTIYKKLISNEHLNIISYNYMLGEGLGREVCQLFDISIPDSNCQTKYMRIEIRCSISAIEGDSYPIYGTDADILLSDHISKNNTTTGITISFTENKIDKYNNIMRVIMDDNTEIGITKYFRLLKTVQHGEVINADDFGFEQDSIRYSIIKEREFSVYIETQPVMDNGLLKIFIGGYAES